VSRWVDRNIAVALLPLKEAEASQMIGRRQQLHITPASLRSRTPRRFLISTGGVVVLMYLLCVVNTNYRGASYLAGFLHCQS
jgi:hypothetical protein